MFARSSSAFLYVLLALTAFVATTSASPKFFTDNHGTSIGYNYGRGEPSASSGSTAAYETPAV